MKIEPILKEQEKMNEDNKCSTIDRETGKLLHLLVKIKNPKNILEVGTSIGYSTIWMASAMNKSAKLTTIDRWNERLKIAKKFFEKARLNITQIEGNALDVIPTLKTKFDVVFLDATKSEYLKYLKSIKLNKNALIIADNTISHKDKMKDFLGYANKRQAITLNIGKGITLLSN